MVLICISDFFNSIITGIIVSILFFLFGYFIQTFRYWFHLKRKFHKVHFNTYWKRFPNEIVQTVTCTVKRNIILFSGNRLNKKDVFEGHFIINPINLKTGKGFYTHHDSEGFAFPRMIIKDENTFFVEAPYTGIRLDTNNNKKAFRVYQAFIWRKE